MARISPNICCSTPEVVLSGDQDKPPQSGAWGSLTAAVLSFAKRIVPHYVKSAVVIVIVAGAGDPAPPPRRTSRLLQVRGCLVHVSLDKITSRAHYSGANSGPSAPLWEGLLQRLDGLRLPVERQNEGTVGEQPGPRVQHASHRFAGMSTIAYDVGCLMRCDGHRLRDRTRRTFMEPH